MKSITERILDHPFFAGMEGEHRAKIAMSGRFPGAVEKEYGPGEIIFEQGGPARAFYLIEAGRIALETTGSGGRRVKLQELSAGEVLGWSWLFPPYLWHFNARAIEPSKLIVLDAVSLELSAQEEKAFCCELMKRVAQIVISRLQFTRKLLGDRQETPRETG
jgi:CRP/FNR family transcriptional regulator, cyclic AMP receptor protein